MEEPIIFTNIDEDVSIEIDSVEELGYSISIAPKINGRRYWQIFNLLYGWTRGRNLEPIGITENVATHAIVPITNLCSDTVRDSFHNQRIYFACWVGGSRVLPPCKIRFNLNFPDNIKITREFFPYYVDNIKYFFTSVFLSRWTGNDFYGSFDIVKEDNTIISSTPIIHGPIKRNPTALAFAIKKPTPGWHRDFLLGGVENYFGAWNLIMKSQDDIINRCTNVYSPFAIFLGDDLWTKPVIIQARRREGWPGSCELTSEAINAIHSGDSPWTRIGGREASSYNL